MWRAAEGMGRLRWMEEEDWDARGTGGEEEGCFAPGEDESEGWVGSMQQTSERHASLDPKKVLPHSGGAAAAVGTDPSGGRLVIGSNRSDRDPSQRWGWRRERGLRTGRSLTDADEIW